jgi:hypothetical protein
MKRLLLACLLSLALTSALAFASDQHPGDGVDFDHLTIMGPGSGRGMAGPFLKCEIVDYFLLEKEVTLKCPKGWFSSVTDTVSFDSLLWESPELTVDGLNQQQYLEQKFGRK